MFIGESYIVNLYRGMSKLKLKINVDLPHLLFIVVSVALHGEFERFGRFCVDCYYVTLTTLTLYSPARTGLTALLSQRLFTRLAAGTAMTFI